MISIATVDITPKIIRHRFSHFASQSTQETHHEMLPASQFSLSSTATTLAFILPPEHSTDVNSIRSVHDRAYHKWPPPINVLYPSVAPEQLHDALPLFREALNRVSRPTIVLDQIGTFSHRKNATIYLQPSEDANASISQLRSRLVKAIGLSDRAGTLDGTYRPHLSIGQASIRGNAIDRLVEKVKPLTGIRWEATTLAVLRRKPTGQMEVIDHIQLGERLESATDSRWNNEQSMVLCPVWTSCFAYCPDSGRYQRQDHPTDALSEERTISVLSYNLLSDTFGCSFVGRLPLIIEAIKAASEPIAEVLCLQEVSNSMIFDILDHPFIQTHYPFCSHSHSSTLVNHLNLVTLSTVPFEFQFHHFNERGKSALVVRPQSIPVEIANIHLTTSLKDNMIAAKQCQIASLTSFLNMSTESSGRKPIIAGDFNLATSSITIQAALKKGDISFVTSIGFRAIIDPDVWSDAYLLSRKDFDPDSVDDEDGATFDVQINPLAAESIAPADQRPQRYDRILFRKNDHLSVEKFHLFGLPNAQKQCGSDHFGVGAVLHITDHNTAQAPRISSDNSCLINTIQDDSNIALLIDTYRPSQQDREERVVAISRLAKILASDIRLADIAIVPLGSYAMETYFSDSDVDVLVVGSLAPSAFFNVATARLGTVGDGLKGLHYINSLVPVIEVEILGIKFDAQYCQAPQILSNKSAGMGSMEELVFDDDIIAKLHPSALRPLNTYRDSVYLLRSIQCLDAFRTAHRFLSLYFRRRGLYSAKFGYLGGVHLSLMLNHVLRRIKSPICEATGAATLVRTFIKYYSQFQWESEIICDSAYLHTNYHRSPREPVVILAIHSPTARPNVASSCSRLSAKTFTREFQLANSKLVEADWEWLLRDRGSTLEDFIANFTSFIVTSIDIWDLQNFGERLSRDFLGSLESRVPALMVNLGRVEGLHGQAWPFRLRGSPDEVEPGKQVKVYYLIGVYAPKTESAAARKLVQSKVLQAAQNYETVIRNSDNYDERHIWAQVEVKNRRKVLEMSLEIH
jgi:poly(A) polymerase Pap1/endonuclease/exonuclease/phosphatase family metal-dependent hydrolase